MVDFTKIPPSSELKDYLYRCERCGDETWYLLKLPGHMRRHHDPLKRQREWCNGLLKLVKSRWRYPEKRTMRKRSEISKAKPSAEERTGTLPGTEDKSPGPGSDCPECGETIEAGTATKRPDGQWECPHCAMPIKYSPGGVARQVEEPKSEQKAKAPNTSSEHKASPRGDEAPSPTYCGECGTRLTDAKAADGGWVVYYPCGHNRKEHGKINDPEQARKFRPVAGSQIIDTKLPQTEPSKTTVTNVINAPAEYHGPTISIEWPACSFRVSEYNNFKTSSFFISSRVGPHETVDQVAARVTSELRKLADQDFEEKSSWYLQKLGLLAKKMK